MAWMDEDGRVSISRRGLLAAGFSAAVVVSIGAYSMINATADDNPTTPAPATAQAADTVTPPNVPLPWGAKPQQLKVGAPGSSSAQLAAAGKSAARDPGSSTTAPTPRYGPKGRITSTGALTKQLAVVPPTVPGVASSDDLNYLYSVGKQAAVTDGAAALMLISKPRLGSGDSHSLAEIALQSADTQQVIEVGWAVDAADGPDPRLFVFSWVDGVPQCYNACGYKPATGAPIVPGAVLPTGQLKNFGIQHINGAWWIAYDTDWIGMFPDSQWGGKLLKSGQIQFFGEMASARSRPCGEMGNGLPALVDSAAKISSAVFVNGPTVTLDIKNIDNSVWPIFKFSDRTFRFGGPGLATTGLC
jgi:hypothetical protein